MVHYRYANSKDSPHRETLISVIGCFSVLQLLLLFLGDTVEYVNGTFKILGRKSVDIIKSGGYKLSALEIETQLLGMEEIQDVSVVGLPDPTWGQKVAAMIVWNAKELSLDQLRELAKKRLPPYACPTRIQTIDKLPRNMLGKVNKKELVKLFT